MAFGRIKMTVFFIGFLAVSILSADFRIGPKVGFSMGNLYGSVIEEEEDDYLLSNIPQNKGYVRPRFVVTGGIEWGIAFNKILTLQSEVLYAGKGEELGMVRTQGSYKMSYSETYQYEYVGVPLLLRVTAPMKTKVRVYFIAGPSFDFLVSSQIRTIETATGYENKIDYENFNDHSNNFDLSMVYGLGIDIKAGPGYIDLNARFGMGLLNTFHSSDSDKEEKIKTNYGAFTIGYIFEF